MYIKKFRVVLQSAGTGAVFIVLTNKPMGSWAVLVNTPYESLTELGLWTSVPQDIERIGCSAAPLVLKPRRAIFSGFTVPNSWESYVSFGEDQERTIIQRGVPDTVLFVARISTPRICSAYPVVDQFYRNRGEPAARRGTFYALKSSRRGSPAIWARYFALHIAVFVQRKRRYAVCEGRRLSPAEGPPLESW